MPVNFDPRELPMDTPHEGDQEAERLGELDESRCQPAPSEVRASVNQTLDRAFPPIKS